MQSLNDHSQQTRTTAWLQLGFRPFFLGAGLFAIASIALWMLAYSGGLTLPLASLSPYHWHAHEMIFGYGVAVIAGFTLTAAKNWTGIQTTQGMRLLSLFSCWLVARIAISSGMLALAGVADLVFLLSLCVALATPIVQRKQWGQLPVVAIVFMLLVANSLFYAGALGWLEQGARLGVYTGLYLTMGIILLMGRRVVPFFIARGVDGDTALRNSATLDITILVLFTVFSITSLAPALHAYARYAALLLFVATAIRNFGWHTPLLWRKPLLWSLYLALWFFSLGFLLYFSADLFGFSPFLSVHAFGYGGIGLLTLSMMSRVALGHTGRNVQAPPASVGIFLLLLLLGAVVRVVLPLVLPMHYVSWVVISQLLWITAFIVFALIYTPYLIQPRTDGKPG